MNITILSMLGSARRLRFKKEELNFLFFDAITEDRNNIFNDKLSKIIYGRDLNRGEIGCSLSHFYMAKKFDDNSKWEIILEDDAIITKAFNVVIDEISQLSINRPTIILLGHSKTAKKNLWLQRLKQPLVNKLKFKNFTMGNTINTISGCGTVAYAINKKAADLIANNEVVFWLADDWKIISNMGIDIYHLDEFVVWEDINLQSTIGNQSFLEHDLFHRPLHNIFVVFKEQSIRLVSAVKCLFQ